MQKSKTQIVSNIKAKARHIRFGLRHDPEPMTADVAQNVGSDTFSLLIDMPRHCR